MTFPKILSAIRISNKIWIFFDAWGYGRGLFDPKSHNFYRRKKLFFDGTSIFEGVPLNIMLGMHANQVGDFITFLLVVIACQNSYF